MSWIKLNWICRRKYHISIEWKQEQIEQRREHILNHNLKNEEQKRIKGFSSSKITSSPTLALLCLVIPYIHLLKHPFNFHIHTYNNKRERKDSHFIMEMERHRYIYFCLSFPYRWINLSFHVWQITTAEVAGS